MLCIHPCGGLPLVSSASWIVNETNCIWTCVIPPISPASGASSFIAISRAFGYDRTFCCISGLWMCGGRPTMNHSSRCWYRIWKVNLPITSLKHWSKSHTHSVCTYLTSFILVMYCDSEFGFLNSFNSALLIYAKVVSCLVGIIPCNFIYYTTTRPLIVVANCAIFTASPCMFLATQIVSQTNECWSGSFDLTPLNSGSLRLLSIPAMLVCVVPHLGDVGRLWFWICALHPLFILLVLCPP